MFITKESFRACAGIMGFESIRGMEFEENEISEEKMEMLFAEMKDTEVLEPAGNGSLKVWSFFQPWSL